MGLSEAAGVGDTAEEDEDDADWELDGPGPS